MEKIQLLDFVLSQIRVYCDENTIEVKELTHDTRLFGSGGLFDSMDLVSFIVELENALEDEHGVKISLTDEKAMSRRTSPFINPDALSDFIFEHINE